jgi:hypothetical protein
MHTDWPELMHNLCLSVFICGETTVPILFGLI